MLFRSIKKFYDTEIKKYNDSKEEKYKISSMYVNLSSERHKNEKVPLIYNLLKENNGKYILVSIICNYNLATQFEESSPDWALKHINEAIRLSENNEKKYYLPNLYDFKGRLLYNKGEYQKAIRYFNKALKTFDKKKEIIYIASMHNNFGMCYAKMGKLDMAITETNKAIQILTQKKILSNQQKIFFYYVKGSLAQYYLELKKYDISKKLFLEEWSFSFKNGYNRMTLFAAKDILSIYNITGKRADEEEIISSLKIIEPRLEKIEDKILLTKLIKDHYLNENNTKEFKLISRKLGELNVEHDQLSQKELNKTVDIIDTYIIKEINLKNNIQRRKNLYLTISIILIIISSIYYIWNIIKIRKRKELLSYKEKIILKNAEKALEKDLLLQKEKTKNLHLSLNLKTETERAFLENIKKIRRNKNIEPEEIIKDLQFKINNLIQIDKKNSEIVIESNAENKLFMNKLAENFPVLTSQELKLCVYFRLNLSGKEIALLENFTVGSIRVYKTKIKSKIGVDKEINLSDFLNTI